MDTLTLPIVPLRDVVVFPDMMMPFVVGRAASIQALNHALLHDKQIFVAAQRDAATADPAPEDIHRIGCVATVVQALALPDGSIKVLIEGVDRANIVEWDKGQGFDRVVVQLLRKVPTPPGSAKPMIDRVVSSFERYVTNASNLHYDAMIAAVRLDDPGKLADTIAAHLLIRTSEKQELLEVRAPLERLGRIETILTGHVGTQELERRIKARVKKQIQQIRNDFYASQRKKAIESEIEELNKQLSASPAESAARQEIVERLHRLAAMTRSMETRESSDDPEPALDYLAALVRDATEDPDEPS